MSEVRSEAPVVLITGSAKRIGAAISRLFHARGFNVILHCHRSIGQARGLMTELNKTRNDSCKLLQFDLSVTENIKALADETRRCFNRLDVLVNNAAAFYATPFSQCDQTQWDDIINSNLKSAFFLSQQLAKTLLQNKQGNSAIINIADIYANRPLPDYPIYSISKAAVTAMTRSLALQLAPHVRVNSVSPGAILLPEEKMSGPDRSSEEQKLISKIPLGRLGSTLDIAACVYFLAWEASYMTGANITVDGGKSLCV